MPINEEINEEGINAFDDTVDMFPDCDDDNFIAPEDMQDDNPIEYDYPFDYNDFYGE